MMSAISRAERVNVPGGGAVEIVVTVCTQRRFFDVFRMTRVSIGPVAHRPYRPRITSGYDSPEALAPRDGLAE